ncbi:MAG: hypothetical protein N3A38_07470, partial [Planctomycetota bacterium]|nr:hypothetical protein [Planctomycetota bacterium]
MKGFSIGCSMAMIGLVSVATWAGTEEELNPYQGRQERENVFEFASKPKVEKRNGRYVISFASRAACDATVAVVLPGAGPGGQGDKVIRHLASGVLGRNAPWP